MTPKEMQEAARALEAKVGKNCCVSIMLNTDSRPPCHGSVYPDGLVKGSAFNKSADDWPELFAALNAKWDEYVETHRARKIRDMALAIIRITAEHGACSDAALRANTFTADDVGRYGEEACAEADAMAANGPFSIVQVGTANAA